MINKNVLRHLLKFSALSLLFVFVGFSPLKAAHLVGGEITYECLGIDTINGVPMITLAFTATMYRDCQGMGASFDSPADFSIFNGSGNDWSFVDDTNAAVSISPDVPLTNDPCVEPPPNVCLDKGVYMFEFTVPVSDESYMVVYQRCCRNNSIVNIVDPQDTGVSFTVTISPLAQSICNNSPVFNDLPPAVICGNKPFVFDHSAADQDGHSIVYEFCAPLDGGGTNGIFGNPGNVNDCEGVNPDVFNCPPPYDPIIFKLPDFNAQIPLGAAANLLIDANSGLMTGSPMNTGQYVVGVCIKEYLNGELLGTVQRDFQFNVTQCVINVQAGIDDAEETAPKNLSLKHCGSDPLTIINSSQDEATIEGYLWQFYISSTETLEYDTRDVDVPFPDPGFYTGLMIVNPDVNGCSDTLFLEIDVFPDMEADFTLEYDTCVAEAVKFKDQSFTETGVILEWDWEFNTTSQSKEKDPKFFYDTPGEKSVFLQTRDLNGCIDTITKSFDYFPAPPVVVVEPNTFEGCAPSEILFNNLSSPIDTTYQVLWDFGDGTFGTEINEIHEYSEIGVYSVGVQIVSPLDCEVSRTYPFWIEVLPEPIADFSFTPDEPKGEDVVMEFFNESTDAISWQYIFDEESSVYQPNPTFVFDTLGEHTVDLIVTHPSGCPDTIRKTFFIGPQSTYFIPNAFSPNGDGINDVFKGKGNFEYISDFEMSIYSRTGEQVFLTNDIEEGWNGRIRNVGKDLPPDVYVLKLFYLDAEDNPVDESGFITLVR